jgi:hypothetical protein
MPVPLLADVKSMVLAHLAERVANLRAAYVAPIGGQDAAYQAKADQARDYLALPDPKNAEPLDYPAQFGQEAAARKVDAPEMAVLIATAAKRWHQASDRIDAVAFQASVAIAKADTAQELIAVLRALPVEV